MEDVFFFAADVEGFFADEEAGFFLAEEDVFLPEDEDVFLPEEDAGFLDEDDVLPAAALVISSSMSFLLISMKGSQLLWTDCLVFLTSETEVQNREHEDHDQRLLGEAFLIFDFVRGIIGHAALAQRRFVGRPAD